MHHWIFSTSTADAVADGGSLPFKQFDPFEGVGEDDLEKVLKFTSTYSLYLVLLLVFFHLKF